MAENTVERIVMPFNPAPNRVINNEQYHLFAPVVGRNKIGMAGFNSGDFKVSANSIVYLSDALRIYLDDLGTETSALGREKQDKQLSSAIGTYTTVEGLLAHLYADDISYGNSIQELYAYKQNKNLSVPIGGETTVEGALSALRRDFDAGEIYIGQMEYVVSEPEHPWPSDAIGVELTAFVVQETSELPITGNVVIVIILLEDETDEVYKYRYNGSTWDGYQIPAVELATNFEAGIVKGNYGDDDYDEWVRIEEGEITGIYVRIAGTIVSLTGAFDDIKGEINDLLVGNQSVAHALSATNAVNDENGDNIANNLANKLNKDEASLIRTINITYDGNNIVKESNKLKLTIDTQAVPFVIHENTRVLITVDFGAFPYTLSGSNSLSLMTFDNIEYPVKRMPNNAVVNDLQIFKVINMPSTTYQFFVYFSDINTSNRCANLTYLNLSTYASKTYVDNGDALKLDKVTSSGSLRVYGVTAGGAQTMLEASTTPSEGTLARWTTDGKMNVAIPTTSGEAANKGYVDTADALKLDKVTTNDGFAKVYYKKIDGTQDMMVVSQSISTTTGAIAKRDENNRLHVATPSSDSHAATKGYVDGKIKYYRHKIILYQYDDPDGLEAWQENNPDSDPDFDLNPNWDLQPSMEMVITLVNKSSTPIISNTDYDFDIRIANAIHGAINMQFVHVVGDGNAQQYGIPMATADMWSGDGDDSFLATGDVSSGLVNIDNFEDIKWMPSEYAYWFGFADEVVEIAI